MMASTTPRAVGIARLIVSLFLALALGATLVPTADAVKKGKNTIASVKERVRAQKEMCEVYGGTATVTVRPGGTSVSCEGGEGDGKTCVNSSKKTRCYQHRTSASRAPLDVGSAPPTGSVSDDPSAGGSDSSSGDVTAPPGGETEQG